MNKQVLTSLLKPGKKFTEVFPFAKRIGRLIHEGSMDELRQLVSEMFETYFSGKKFGEMIDIYLELCHLIDRTKVNIFGADAPTDGSNAIMFALANEIIRRISVENPLEMALLEKRFNELGLNDEKEGWNYAKLATFRSAYHSKLALTLYSHTMMVPNARQKLDDVSRLFPDAQTALTHLMSELHRLKMYGIKNAYFTDGIMQRDNQVWVIMDHQALGKFHHINITERPETMAMILLAKEQNVRDYNAKVELITKGEGSITKLDLGFEPDLIMNISTRGELYYGNYEIPYLSVGDIFRKDDKEAEYELLRYAQIMRLWDLMVPVTRVRQVSTARRQGNLIERILHISQAITPDLILPRVRLIEDHAQEVQAELEREIEEADERTKRVIGRHDVTHHIRHLPTGRHASPDAIQNAHDHGFELKPGETYVRKHERGSGEAINSNKIYRAVKRR